MLAAVTDFSSGLGRRKISTFSAACAYYLFMSLVPLIMLLCAVMQYTPLTEELVLDAIAEYVPPSMYELVSRIVTTVYAGGRVALTVSLILTIWSASASVRALMRGLDAVYDQERQESFLRFSAKSVLYMLILVAMLMMSFFVMVYGGKIIGLLEVYLPASAVLDFFLGLAKYFRFFIVMVLLALVFVLLYRWMPAEKNRYRRQWAGALFAAVAWVLFSWVFSLYVNFSNKFGAYGFLGTVMVTMMWMYFCFYFLLLGGYINRYADLHHAAPPPASPSER